MVTISREEERAIGRAQRTLRGESPAEFQWIEFLSRPHLILFTVELKDALEKMGASGQRTEVLELLDAWKATAELDADPETAAELLRQKDESDYVEWDPERRK